MDIPSRVAVAEDRIAELQTETKRMRDRLHVLESDRATLSVLRDQVRELATNTERIAARAAEKALETAFTHRDALNRRRWKLIASYLSMGATLGGFVIALVFHFTH